jgi:hypothetical protein
LHAWTSPMYDAQPLEDRRDEMELVPILCPKCATFALTGFPIAVIVIGLTSGKQMRLYSACHDAGWDA